MKKSLAEQVTVQSRSQQILDQQKGSGLGQHNGSKSKVLQEVLALGRA